ncbi:hypothetical protein IWQ62_003586, partial [Dispira parvispora]
MNPQQPPPPRPQQPWGQQQHPPQGPHPGMPPRPMPGQPIPRPPATSGGGVPPPRPLPPNARPGMPHPRPMGGPPGARPQGYPQQQHPAPHSAGPRPPGYPAGPVRPGAPAAPYQRPPQQLSGPGMHQRPMPPATAPVVSPGAAGPAQMSNGVPSGPQFISPMDNVANQMANMHVNSNVPDSSVARAPRSKHVYAQGLTAAPAVPSPGLPPTHATPPGYNHQGGPPAPGPNMGPVRPGQPQPSGPVRPPGYDQPKQRIDPDKIPSP